MENNEMPQAPSATNQNEIICSCCGAKLTFAPGSMSLKCEFCGTMNEIKIDQSKMAEAVKELDLEAALNNIGDEQLEEVHAVKCNCCGAETTFQNNVVSSKCDFCGSPLTVKQDNTVKQLKPKAILPFEIDSRKGQELYNQWIKDLWFAPSDLKNVAKLDSGLTGMYMPYWTYDAETYTRYQGKRGEYYYTEEEYRDQDGKTKTRQVKHTRWYPAWGKVHVSFDDILIPASNSLPSHFLDNLKKWKLDKLVPYDEKFLSGFKTETYSVDLKTGFDKAKDVMEDEIEDKVCEDIGGDEQKIESKTTTFSDLTFKHILLPIWLCAFRYGDKSYRFVVNGQTGEIKGDRPYSAAKIAIAILAVIAVIVLLFMLMSK
ncbi:MAG: hypothetical protein MJZ66_02925 [Bacteroidales bacterium]|nr:hypothetical protein [Bacteroidales bacterium]